MTFSVAIDGFGKLLPKEKEKSRKNWINAVSFSGGYLAFAKITSALFSTRKVLLQTHSSGSQLALLPLFYRALGTNYSRRPAMPLGRVSWHPRDPLLVESPTLVVHLLGTQVHTEIFQSTQRPKEIQRQSHGFGYTDDTVAMRDLDP